MKKFFVDVMFNDDDVSYWYSVNAANAEEAEAKAEEYFNGGITIVNITEKSPVNEITNVEKYYVMVKVNTTDGVENDIYSIYAENDTDAAQIVRDWIGDECPYADYCDIEGVYTYMPIDSLN